MRNTSTDNSRNVVREGAECTLRLSASVGRPQERLRQPLALLLARLQLKSANESELKLASKLRLKLGNESEATATTEVSAAPIFANPKYSEQTAMNTATAATVWHGVKMRYRLHVALPRPSRLSLEKNEGGASTAKKCFVDMCHNAAENAGRILLGLDYLCIYENGCVNAHAYVKMARLQGSKSQRIEAACLNRKAGSGRFDSV